MVFKYEGITHVCSKVIDVWKSTIKCPLLDSQKFLTLKIDVEKVVILINVKLFLNQKMILIAWIVATKYWLSMQLAIH